MEINELVGTFTFVHRDQLYFRVEIFSASTGATVEIMRFFSETYLLRFPNGASAFPSARSDTSFRQSWLYLEDFKAIWGSSPADVKDSTIEALQRFGDAYLEKFNAKLKRQQ